MIANKGKNQGTILSSSWRHKVTHIPKFECEQAEKVQLGEAGICFITRKYKKLHNFTMYQSLFSRKSIRCQCSNCLAARRLVLVTMDASQKARTYEARERTSRRGGNIQRVDAASLASLVIWNSLEQCPRSGRDDARVRLNLPLQTRQSCSSFQDELKGIYRDEQELKQPLKKGIYQITHASMIFTLTVAPEQRPLVSPSNELVPVTSD